MTEDGKWESKKDDKKPSKRSLEDILKASISYPERSSMYIRSEIIKAIKSQDGYEYSKNGQRITFEGLCLLLPELTREEIVSAIVDMRGVEVLSSATGTILLPEEYFWL